MRYEVTVRPEFVFGEGLPALEEFASPLVIQCAGHDFVWHPSRNAPDDYGACGPVVTLSVADGDVDAAALAANRFLAALCFVVDRGIGIGWSVVTGFKEPLDAPTACEPAMRAREVVRPVHVIDVIDDDRLFDVLGLYREGISAESPFHHFLSLHNALVAAFDGSENDAERYASSVEHGVQDAPVSPADLGKYFRDVMRNAIAHTVRPAGRPTLDPNSPRDRASAAVAAQPLRLILRRRVEQRWPGAVRTAR